ncbi:hypothetical protein DSH63_16040, partial [Enterococcus faecalis]|nr:hypothetical protein [Enterococcus faecalis]
KFILKILSSTGIRPSFSKYIGNKADAFLLETNCIIASKESISINRSVSLINFIVNFLNVHEASTID